jgi:hypothetical protein
MPGCTTTSPPFEGSSQKHPVKTACLCCASLVISVAVVCAEVASSCGVDIYMAITKCCSSCDPLESALICLCWEVRGCLVSGSHDAGLLCRFCLISWM